MNKLTKALRQLDDKKRAQDVAFACLTIFGMSLLFLQLSFFPIGLGTDNIYFHTALYYIPIIMATYLLPLRQYVAFCIIMCLGLMLHAHVMPIDYYEIFVGRLPMVISTSLSGGVLFWLAKMLVEFLRKKLKCGDKPALKREAVLVVVMVLSSALMVLTSLNAYPVFGDNSGSASLAASTTPLANKVTDLSSILCTMWDGAVFSITAIITETLLYRNAEPASKRTLQSVFRRALLLVMLMAFLVTTTVGYCMETLSATTACDAKLESTLDYVENQVTLSNQRYAEVKAAQDNVMVENAVAAATMLNDVKDNVPSMQDYVVSIAKSFKLTSFTVCDENGTVEYDSEGKGIGSFNFGSTEVTRPYLGLIDGKVPYIVEEPRASVDESGQTTEMRSFAGAPRLDEKGFVQISMDATDFAATVEGASVSHLLDNYRFDADGTVILSDGNTVISANRPSLVGFSTLDLFNSSAITGEAQADTEQSKAGTIETYCNDDMGLTRDAESMEFVYYRGRKVGGHYIVAMMPSTSVFGARTGVVVRNTLIYLLLFASVFALISLFLRRLVTSTLERTNGVLARITGGDLDQKVEERAVAEFSELSDGINSTVVALKDSIAEAAARYDADLATAKAIQESALPRTFPPFPEVEAFDIYASMNAAREVGGDFYDFFLIDERTLGFLIADVSGKGIPASLFMMAAKNQIANYMGTGMDLAQAIASANARLCEGNDAGMFVTVWAATLDWETGLLTYVNAGHNFPLLRRGGEWSWIKEKCGLFLGTFERAKYRSKTLRLEPGDELVLYTDGVNEAFSRNDEEYGNDRLEAYLSAHADEHPHRLVTGLRGDVATWARGAEQSDDITILALEYGVKPEVEASITVPARVDQLGRVLDFINAELDRRLCPIAVERKLDVAIEEMFVNVCNYAYADRETSGPVTVSYRYTPEPALIAVMIEDEGVPFDPLTRTDPTMPADIQDVPVGGLGIMMTKRLVDDISYVRDGDTNQLVFTKGW